MIKAVRNLRQIPLFMRDRNFIKQVAKDRVKGYAQSLTMAIVGLMVTGAVSAQNADPGNLRPPDVPDKIKVDQGNKLFLVGRAVGTQNYVCKASGSGFKFVLFTPQATLFGA